uniref:Uncharacterized protein n=1 Tax=viral metagenome TaxID=1070528 RepID=A0A6C0LRN5_9ZZZZ
MNVIIHLLILFIFIVTILILNIPKINEKNNISMKIYIFISIFLFEFFVDIFNTVTKKCVINLNKITRASLQAALIAVVAYSIYIDVLQSSNSFVTHFNSNKSRKIIIAIFITVFLLFNYLIEEILMKVYPKMNDYLNDFYKAK